MKIPTKIFSLFLAISVINFAFLPILPVLAVPPCPDGQQLDQNQDCKPIAPGESQTCSIANPNCPAGQTCQNGICAVPACPTCAPVFQPTPGGTPTVQPFQPKKLDNPLVVNSIEALLGRIIRLMIGVSGTAALVMFVWGGILWITAAGDAQKITKGKKIFTWATIGMVLIFGSYAIVNTLFQIVVPQ